MNILEYQTISEIVRSAAPPLSVGVIGVTIGALMGFYSESSSKAPKRPPNRVVAFLVRQRRWIVGGLGIAALVCATIPFPHHWLATGAIVTTLILTRLENQRFLCSLRIARE